MKQIYSCRAECPHDVEVFLKTIPASNIDVLSTTHHVPYTDASLEFSSSMSMDALQKVLGNQVDTHVMSQTLLACALKDNPLKRTYADYVPCNN